MDAGGDQEHARQTRLHGIDATGTRRSCPQIRPTGRGALARRTLARHCWRAGMGEKMERERQGSGAVCARQTWRLRMDRSAWMVSVTTFIVVRSQVPLPIPPLSLLSLPCGVRRADLSLQDYFQQTGSWGVVKWKWMHPKLTVLLASKPALISVKQQHPVRPLSPAACRRIGDVWN